MSRPRFAWSIFGICLLATASAVGWLTHSAWRADQARQQALRESEIRNALWRMDSLVAPLLAIETNRPAFSNRVTGGPMLAHRLISGYAVRNSAGEWTIRMSQPGSDWEKLPGDSPLASAPWEKLLAATDSSGSRAPAGDASGNPAQASGEDLITWVITPPRALKPLAEIGYAVSPETISFGAMSPGERKTLNFVVRGPKSFAIQKIEAAESPQLFETRLSEGSRKAHVLPLTLIAPMEAGPVNEDITITVAGSNNPMTFHATAQVVAAMPQAGTPQAARNSMSGQELQNRNQFLQQVQQIAAGSQRAPGPIPPPNADPLQPLWAGTELVCARQLPLAPGETDRTLEVCWLNWPEWERLLTDQLDASTIPLKLRRVEELAGRQLDSHAASWQMVSLPIAVEPLAAELPGSWPIPYLAVWGLLLAAALAFGWLMRQTLALSERRAAFVSAVTHELRTPLTTFRLYTEILSEGLATEPAQQQTYFQTLHREANRLTHLVENVLAYARLEHGRSTARNETLSVGDLIDRCRPRLEQRVAETPLTLTFQIADSARSVRLTTNALAFEQILFNLIDNSCKYARDAVDPRIVCDVLTDEAELLVRVSDFGPGLSPAARKALFQPFQKSSSQAAESAPGVGLGLALSHRLARELQGSLRCEPNTPTGLSFEIRLPLAAH